VIAVGWPDGLPSFLWQVMLHSSVAGLVVYAWAQRVGLPSGRAKRRLLVVLLVLPLVTAAIPGRAGAEFRDRWAWLDSGRVLAVPLGLGIHVADVVVLVAAMMVAITVVQELVPVLRRRRATAADVPDELRALARDLPGWERCLVAVQGGDDVLVATGGRPGRPRLVVSRGALARLTPDELALAVRHEHAHWQGGRWLRLHALFVVRLLQCYHPVALVSFREYCLEVEIECDAAAVAGRDARPLTRALLTTYEATPPREVAARSALRRRAGVLLGDIPVDDDALPPATLVAVTAILLAVLPWLV
jgi:hypothetical protein